MSNVTCLIRFQSKEDGRTYFANVDTPQTLEGEVKAFGTFEDLQNDRNGKKLTIDKLLAPVPDPKVPIYCVGLNYKSHAKEASLKVPSNPPLWTKPAASLANPDEDIPINDFCAKAFPDWEGELVFVTSKECRDLTEEQAKSYILGYTIGNDLSCRMFQLPEMSSGQFFYAKAFDKFAPMGPVLVSPKIFNDGKGVQLTTKVNGEVMQDVEYLSDVVFSPARILSHMSQGTTIPAYTAVMTGTPSGVGAFRKPRRFLRHNEVVEVSISNIGTLKNKVVFESDPLSVLLLQDVV
ncbi:uncharacterized protein Z518_01971 [Rhinocladiella mackenziei CBS 650.93]|uniref:Fumarylacetoacetase-like C-terminal domain-containing protein n=1 Tax=Rhinocladiella mackenziei CBS 650.93 TaxID=1442369 RepID=A0A0D2HA07_9EURO|nr:uncharacterized protein Z518_01971 [Rhinocladiella mackenziei CBS 650.93]KIX07318.1 hypothetical protein Z518_01971 [Rhinocladiella mackenziei CBS 650.93]